MVGTGIAFFPVFREYNESVAIGYAAFRILEAVFVAVGAVSILAILSLRQEFASGAALDESSLQTAGVLLRSIHDWTFTLGPNVMLGINTSMAAYILYRTKIVPRPIATLGLVGAVLISIAGVLTLFGVIGQFSAAGALLALPIFTYEMSLAVWLLVRGFNGSVSAPVSETSAPGSETLQQG